MYVHKPIFFAFASVFAYFHRFHRILIERREMHRENSYSCPYALNSLFSKYNLNLMCCSRKGKKKNPSISCIRCFHIEIQHFG